MLQANQDKLGIGPDFGLKLQSITRVNQDGQDGQPWQSRQLRPSRGQAQTIVRVQLTEGRGAGATPLDNHGILVFRASGGLADYHTPLPEDGQTALLTGNAFAQTPALAKLSQAYQIHLNEHGVPLALVRTPEGRWTVEARVPRGEGPFAWMEVFTPDNPLGERHEVMVPPVPRDKRIPSADDLLK
ncbi:MAG: hypothetical protein ABI977_21050 [Acidobacteriota bacterium]